MLNDAVILETIEEMKEKASEIGLKRKKEPNK